MKTKSKIISIILILFICAFTAPQKVSAQFSVNFQLFYDELSPYGTWIENPDYGYVWLPNVAPGFIPYSTNGYWVFTDDGWTWVSNYPWGWAPFHYGRWYIDDTYGPVWVPDNEWGPGWVIWRRSSGYYGWAPIEPGISISIAYSNNYNPHYNNWTFVRGRDFGRRNINKYYVNHSQNVTIIKNTTVINNTIIDKQRNVNYNQGPNRTEVEKRVGRRIAPVTIKENNKPGQNLNKNELKIYRPQIQKNNTAGTKPIPFRVENIKDVKTSAERRQVSLPQKETPTAKQQTKQKNTVQPTQQRPSQQQQTKARQNTVQPTQQRPSQQQQVKPIQNTGQPTQQRPSQQQQAKPRQNTGQPIQQRQTQQQQAKPRQNTVQPTQQRQTQQKQTIPRQNTVQPTQQRPSQQQQAKPQHKTEKDRRMR